jgi:hypothetical protein
VWIEVGSASCDKGKKNTSVSKCAEVLDFNPSIPWTWAMDSKYRRWERLTPQKAVNKWDEDEWKRPAEYPVVMFNPRFVGGRGARSKRGVAGVLGELQLHLCWTREGAVWAKNA